MILLSNILLVLGTVLGTLGGARLPDVHWGLTAVGLVLLAAGGGMRRATSGKTAPSTSAANDDTDPLAVVGQLSQALEEVDKGLDDLSLPGLVERLSQLEVDYFRPISDAVPKLVKQLGSQKFAEVFGPYTSGERSLARAWSAAADGHRPEAVACFRQGVEQIRVATEKV